MPQNKTSATFFFDKDRDIDLSPDILAFELSIGFADQVIAECERIGLTQADLASKLGIKASTLSEKLNGQNLTLKSMAAMALALDCDMSMPMLIREEDSTRSRNTGPRYTIGASIDSRRLSMLNEAPRQWGKTFAARKLSVVTSSSHADISYSSHEENGEAA